MTTQVVVHLKKNVEETYFEVVSFSNEKETNSKITTPRHETASPKASSSKDKSNTRSGWKMTPRYKSCPRCDAAVGESNHSNRITIYYDEETGEEDRRGHPGKCKK